MPVPPLTPLAAAALHVGDPERILQLQCGDGEGALFLAREFPRARVRGVDSSEEAIRRANARIGLDPEGRVAFKVGRTPSLPFPDDHFDLVAILDARPSPAELARVLRPSGYLILASSRSSSPASTVLRWNFRRHGFELQQLERAGNGSFLIARRPK
ncbi:MAG: class I SAM-dependent methyltransferase [Solirubrobacterales bacterium]